MLPTGQPMMMGTPMMGQPMMLGAAGQMVSPMMACGYGMPGQLGVAPAAASSEAPPAAAPGAEQPPQAGEVPVQYAGMWWETNVKMLEQAELMQMWQTWLMLDRDRNGHVFEHELALMHVPSGGSNWAGRPIGQAAASRLIQLFDVNGTKSITFYEYAALHKFFAKMQTAFVTADLDRSGTLDANEIIGALKAGGIDNLEKEVVQAYFAKFAMLGWFGHGLDFMAFMMMCCDIALAKSRFEIVDKDKDGKISLTEMLIIAADLTARASMLGQSVY